MEKKRLAAFIVLAVVIFVSVSFLFIPSEKISFLSPDVNGTDDSLTIVTPSTPRYLVWFVGVVILLVLLVFLWFLVNAIISRSSHIIRERKPRY